MYMYVSHLLRVLAFALLSFCISAQSLQLPGEDSLLTPFELNENVSSTYNQTVQYYQILAKTFPSIVVSEYGMTDSGYPLHEVVVSNDGVLDSNKIRNNGKVWVYCTLRQESD